MDRAVKSRAPVRTKITKICNDIAAEIATMVPYDKTLLDLLEKLGIMEEKLQSKDSDVEEAMLDDNKTEQELETELEQVLVYQDKIRLTKKEGLHAVTAVAPVVSKSSNARANIQDQGDKKNYKLPKIELPKFDGDLKKWLGWWSQFQKIDSDKNLHSSDKFQYLIQATLEKTEPREIISVFPPTAENYEAAVESLKRRYGREGLQLQVYLRELLQLVIQNVTKKERIPLDKLYMKLESHLRALKTLDLSKAEPSLYFYPLVESSLPEEVMRAWLRSTPEAAAENGKAKDSKLDSLMNFIKKEVEGEQQIQLAQNTFQEARIGQTKQNSQKHDRKSSNKSEIPTAAGLFSGHTSTCVFCDKSHDSNLCGQAQDMTLNEKTFKIKSKRVCFTCLKGGHSYQKCKAFVKCIVCKKRHPTIMCPELHKKEEVIAAPTQSNLNCTNEVMLQTLKVDIVASNIRKTVRALLDPGAQRSYIKKKTTDELSLTAEGDVKLNHFLFGCRSEIKDHKQYHILVEGQHQVGGRVLEVLDQKSICGSIPRMHKGRWMKELKEKSIWVADLGEDVPEIELLIGSDYYGSILTGKKVELQNGLVAIETVFGWTLSGKVRDESVAMSVTSVSMHVQSEESSISDLWELELIGIKDPMEHKSKEEKDQETKEHFRETVTRSEDGRYSVRLPWIDGVPVVPNNRRVAEQRLISATRRLEEKGQFNAYNEIFESWLAEGIIELDVQVEKEIPCHFLPHRPVFKPESLTTPVRPVFDASNKTKRTPSLNECLHKGPNQLELIPSVMMRFRENQIGVIADIRKAFQMIEVNKEDRNFLKFLWWEDRGKKNIAEYRHTRVVFGVNCSPFLLAAVLEHHLTTVNPEDRKIAQKLLMSLYVDNCVTSVSNEDEYEEFKDKSIRIMNNAKMELRCWERGGVSQEKSNENTMVLGLAWNKIDDTLGINMMVPELPKVITKRAILSAVQKIFDPLGFTVPALLLPKLILQEAWAIEADWDIELKKELRDKFQNWILDVQSLSMIAIPRHINPQDSSLCDCEIHVFCDASKDAYATAVFLRSNVRAVPEIRFLQAKSRIAPLKRVKDKSGAVSHRRASIPRLELLAATIGVRLGYAIQLEIGKEVEIYYWSDSTTVIAWINRNDNWGTFVGNRVKEILKLSRAEDWRHVPGKYNPADLPSRGCSNQQLVESKWWEGPSWLLEDLKNWPMNEEEIVDEELVNSEKQKCTVVHVQSNFSNWLVPKFSSFQKSVNVVGWILRFIRNARKKSETRVMKDYLEIQEVRDAEKKVIRHIQDEAFKTGMDDLKSLKVYVDSEGIIRVKSKLTYRKDSFEFRSPAVLPKSHPLVTQLIRCVHVKNCHAGTQAVLGALREKYWILQGRQAVSKVIHECVICSRYATKNINVETAPLPAHRVESVEAYQNTGVDLAGPLFLQEGTKAWVVLYTCAVYRSVHLDVVTSLSTEAFIRSLERFINTHGRPNVIYTDNGTNFVGTANLFKNLNWMSIRRDSHVKQIQWIFNPPTAAWWGGWWERLVRTVKDLLRKMLGRARLTFDELRTCLSAVEATVNSRPLTTITEDIDDLVPLTPDMFTRGSLGSVFPEGEEVTVRALNSRYKKMQILKTELQARFRREYLSLLVQKGNEKRIRHVEIGDIVLVGSDNKKRFEWPLGRIVEVYPSKDGHVRVAKVRTAVGVLTRPLQRLYPLEIPNPEIVSPSKEVIKKAINKEKVKKARDETAEDPVVTKSGRRVIRPKRYGQWN